MSPTLLRRLLPALGFAALSQLSAQEIVTDAPKFADTPAAATERIGWWTDARYGLFIHWGPYAVAGRGEWVMNRERIPLEEYRANYAENFRAENYDPRAWARLAKEAGMRYVVLTAKHHDGFCLWDTATTDWNSTKLGPRRDIVKEFVEAVRAEGLAVGLYFSFADWSHPDYPGKFNRSFLRQWPDEAARDRFIARSDAQLTELLGNYGKIDILWWDASLPRPSGGAESNALARRLQPHILINDRANDPGDFATSEQRVSAAKRPWEACMTLTPHAWGYHAGEPFVKSPLKVIDTLIETSSQGGNLLLNVGPRADGSIPEEAADTLRSVGAWLSRNREFLAGAEPAHGFSWVNWGRYSVKGETLYAHILYPVGSELCVADLKNPVRSVRVLDGGAPLEFERRDERLFIRGVPLPRDGLAITLAIETEGRPQPIKP